MKFIDTWVNTLRNPENTFKAEKGNANLRNGVKHIAVGAAASGLITAILILLSGTGIVGPIVTIIIYPIIAIISALVLAAIIYLIAGILGGKGEYGTHFGLMAYFYAPMIIIVTLLGLIPGLGGIPNLLAGLYALYMLVASTKEAYQLSATRAVIACLVSCVIFAIPIVLAAIMLGGPSVQ